LREPPPQPSPGVPGEGENRLPSRDIRTCANAHPAEIPALDPQDIFVRFASMDPAGAEPSPDNDPCYTVIQVWDVTTKWDMLLVHQYRKQVQAPDAADAAVSIARDFDCDFIVIERDGLGLGVVQTVRRRGVTVRSVKARGPKEARAQTAQIRMENGQIYFPRGASFLFDLEHELLHFPKSRYNDQVDAMAHAVSMMQRLGGSSDVKEEQITTETRRHGGALDDWGLLEDS
jgi:predicted phage terminase large subunit-like protein